MASDPQNSYSETFSVRYDECGADGTLRASVHLRLMQELAFAHSAALGFPLAWYEAHRLFWLVRRANLVVQTPARYGDALAYTTRVVGSRRVLARRINTVERADSGTLVAAALVDWIITENGTAPTRVPEAMISAFPAMTRSVAPIPLEEGRPPSEAARSSLWIRTSDVDPMGHANNAVYLDLLDDAIVRAGGAGTIGAHPRTYDLQYNAAAPPSAGLRDLAWREESMWRYRLERADGSLLLHGSMTDTCAPVGEAQDIVGKP